MGVLVAQAVAELFGAAVVRVAEVAGDRQNAAFANFPASGGFLLASSFDGNGRVVERQFDSASLAGFRTQLAALIATID